MRVDFPAPFSPISATTSPRSTLKLTWSSATTPGNRLQMPLRVRMGIQSPHKKKPARLEAGWCWLMSGLFGSLELLHIVPVCINLVLGDGQGVDDDDLVGGDHGFVTTN